MAPKRRIRQQRQGLVYVAHSQGHLYEVWWRNKREAQVTFYKGKESTLAIAEEIYRGLSLGHTREHVLRTRNERYRQAQCTAMTHDWDPRILAACDAAMKGKRWTGEVSPRHSRLCSFA